MSWKPSLQRLAAPWWHSKDDACSCAQVLSQGFKQHLGWCKGTRQEASANAGAEGEEGAQDEEEDEEEGNPQELAAIEASKVLGPPVSLRQTVLPACNHAPQVLPSLTADAEVHLLKQPLQGGHLCWDFEYIGYAYTASKMEQ